jgi:hypothetical protein
MFFINNKLPTIYIKHVCVTRSSRREDKRGVTGISYYARVITWKSGWWFLTNYESTLPVRLATLV